MKMKIYVAGPFFSKEERALMNRLQAHLFEFYSPKDFEFFFPMDHFVPGGESLENSRWARCVYEGDIEALDTADLVLAVYHGHYSDSGTAFEIGYATAKGIPIGVLVVDGHIDHSLMVLSSEMCTVYDFNKFVEGESDCEIDVRLLNQK